MDRVCEEDCVCVCVEEGRQETSGKGVNVYMCAQVALCSCRCWRKERRGGRSEEMQ